MHLRPAILPSLCVAFVKIVNDDCSNLERKLKAGRSTDTVELIDDLFNLLGKTIRSG
jgi:hypothetical protein